MDKFHQEYIECHELEFKIYYILLAELQKLIILILYIELILKQINLKLFNRKNKIDYLI